VAQDTASIASGAIQGAKTGGTKGAVVGGVKALGKTKTGKWIIGGLVAFVLFATMGVAGFVSMAANLAMLAPEAIRDYAIGQVHRFIDEHLSWAPFVESDAEVLDYVRSEGGVPWSALFALEEDTARRVAAGDFEIDGWQIDWLSASASQIVGTYGISMGQYEDAALFNECPLATVNRMRDHTSGTLLTACMFTAKLKHIDQDLNWKSIYSGVESYLMEDGRRGYRADPDDPAAQHAKQAFIAMFEAMPIPSAKARAPALYDLMLRAALGIMDSCDNPAVSVGVAMPGTWSDPVQAPTTSPFGWRTDPISGASALHNGQDLGAPCGTPIHAAADGVVTFAAWDAYGGGGMINIDHGNGVTTKYAHQKTENFTVHVGDTVTVGQIIGLVDTQGYSTGCHLHFIVAQDRVDMDPVPFMAARGVTLGVDPPITNDGTTAAPDGDAPSTVTGALQAQSTLGVTWTVEGASYTNAATLVAHARGRNVPDTVMVAMLATALVESHIHNYASRAVAGSADYPNDGVAAGDSDSIGVFQQRPSQGWGTVDQIMTSITYQADQFLDRALVWFAQHPSATPGEVAYAIQRCAPAYADRYTEVTPVAVKLLQALGGVFVSRPSTCNGPGTATPAGPSAESTPSSPPTIPPSDPQEPTSDPADASDGGAGGDPADLMNEGVWPRNHRFDAQLGALSEHSRVAVQAIAAAVAYLDGVDTSGSVRGATLSTPLIACIVGDASWGSVCDTHPNDVLLVAFLQRNATVLGVQSILWDGKTWTASNPYTATTPIPATVGVSPASDPAQHWNDVRVVFLS
jgi:hypothetical protein